MRGMLPPKEARMRMCVMKVGERGRWTYKDWAKWNFLWKWFPWYAREMYYRGSFCIGPSCMHWFWEDPDKKERGYCSAAVSRAQSMMWERELRERDQQRLDAAASRKIVEEKTGVVLELPRRSPGPRSSTGALR
jgi:hypothetical protein